MSRRAAARFAAPAAFLAAVTIAVLLIRAGLGGGNGTPTASSTTASVATTVPTRPAATTTAPRRTRTRTAAGAEYYTVQSGDTFGTIAARYGTSVERIEELNPGVSSSSLTIGQRIRVK